MKELTQKNVARLSRDLKHQRQLDDATGGGRVRIGPASKRVYSITLLEDEYELLERAVNLARKTLKLVEDV